MAYTAQFDPFGQVVSEWSASGDVYVNSKKFATYERDLGTGLDYARARTYGSGWGRFVQSDPVSQGCGNKKPDIWAGKSQTNPQTLNRYIYSLNDPINLFDPTGLDCLGEALECAGGIIASAGGAWYLWATCAAGGPLCWLLLLGWVGGTIATGGSCRQAKQACT